MLKKFLYTGLSILLFYACSKNADPKPVTPPSIADSIPVIAAVKDCKIIYAAAVTSAGDTGDRSYFKYDDAGRLIRSIYQGSYADTVYYSYNGNMIYRSVAAGVNSSVDTLTVNNAGFVTHDKSVVGTHVYMTDWTYDANMQLTTFTQRPDSLPPYGSTYEFTNGDNTLSISGTSRDTMVYDIAKPAVHGNYDEIYQLLSFGAFYVRNKHLMITNRHGDVSTYSYTFNAEGNIASLIEILNNKNFRATYYTYDCK